MGKAGLDIAAAEGEAEEEGPMERADSSLQGESVSYDSSPGNEI